jgi:hypothetical protein
MFALLMGCVYEVHRRAGIRWLDVHDRFLDNRLIGSDIRVILRLLPQQFEGLQCWYY